jgi:hypothetical protein
MTTKVTIKNEAGQAAVLAGIVESHRRIVAQSVIIQPGGEDSVWIHGTQRVFVREATQQDLDDHDPEVRLLTGALYPSPLALRMHALAARLEGGPRERLNAAAAKWDDASRRAHDRGMSLNLYLSEHYDALHVFEQHGGTFP